MSFIIYDKINNIYLNNTKKLKSAEIYSTWQQAELFLKKTYPKTDREKFDVVYRSLAFDLD